VIIVSEPFARTSLSLKDASSSSTSISSSEREEDGEFGCEKAS
jgi:hypothetical protein